MAAVHYAILETILSAVMAAIMVAIMAVIIIVDVRRKIIMADAFHNLSRHTRISVFSFHIMNIQQLIVLQLIRSLVQR